MAYDELKHVVNSTLGTSNFKPINVQISDLKTPGAIKILKNIQRGRATISSRESGVDVNISNVNLNKSILLLSFYTYLNRSSDEPANYGALNSMTVSGKFLDNAHLQFQRGSDDWTTTIDWQVIEFY